MVEKFALGRQYIRSISVSSLVAITLSSCLSRGTPQKYPYAFETIAEERLDLRDQSGRKLQPLYELYPEGWSKVSKCIFDGKELNLKLDEKQSFPQELEKLRKEDSHCNSYYPLPVEGATQHVIGCSAVKLPDGRILIMGGTVLPPGKRWLIPSLPGHFKGDKMTALSCTWYYDPKCGTISSGTSMQWGHRSPNLAFLHDGRILITGGWSDDPSNAIPHAELFDPKKGQFTRLSDMWMPRYDHGTAELSNGDVLIVGGKTSKLRSDSGYRLTATAEILKMSSGTFILIGQLRNSRENAVIIPLANNQAFVCGGEIDESDNSHHYSEPVIEPELYPGKYQDLKPSEHWVDFAREKR